MDAFRAGTGARRVARPATRLPHQPHGQAFLGSYIVPKAARSAVLRVQAAESGAFGQREAMLMGQVAQQVQVRPGFAALPPFPG
ncbi:hypothetical protein ACFHW0_30360 [Micromonospora sp. LOL_025]|uniref:hypothetical protein n=1 Tax=Micromonospora sp. LOL_025 TaxID=3345413 RepID=UPI003A856322